jgi:hypothetical protein
MSRCFTYVKSVMYVTPVVVLIATVNVGRFILVMEVDMLSPSFRTLRSSTKRACTPDTPSRPHVRDPNLCHYSAIQCQYF